MQKFDDLGKFIAHLALVEHHVQREAEEGLKRSARVISDAARAKLGYYQPAAGPFVAWAPLADRTLEQHARYGVGDTPEMLTGELYGSIEDEAHGNEAVSGSRMVIAGYQEVGTPNMPPRPIFGPAAWTSREAIEKIMGAAAMKGMMYGVIGTWSKLG